jgi:hypothetical protein
MNSCGAGLFLDSLRPATSTDAGCRREAEFILCSTAAAFSPDRLDQLRILLKSGVDWEVVVPSAARHGVMQLIYRALFPGYSAHVPAIVLDRMRREVHGNVVRNAYLAAEAVRLSRLLKEHGVAALVLKGPALAADVYGDVALRQFNDLDLLVRQVDLDVAFAVLAADGFRCKVPLKKVQGQLSSWEVTLARERGLFQLDLHWRLSPAYFPFAPEGDELWSRAVEIDLGVGPVATLCPDDLMLFLCAHGAKHGWQALSGVCDVAQATRVHQYEWDRLMAHSSALGSLRIVFLGLVLAHKLLGAVIPEAIINAACAEPTVVRAARTFCQYFDRLGANGPGFYQSWSIPLSMIAQRSVRFRYALARAFLPVCKDFELVALPPALSPLYYGLRPLRLVLQKTPTLVHDAIASFAPREGA